MVHTGPPTQKAVFPSVAPLCDWLFSRSEMSHWLSKSHQFHFQNLFGHGFNSVHSHLFPCLSIHFPSSLYFPSTLHVESSPWNINLSLSLNGSESFNAFLLPMWKVPCLLEWSGKPLELSPSSVSPLLLSSSSILVQKYLNNCNFPNLSFFFLLLPLNVLNECLSIFVLSKLLLILQNPASLNLFLESSYIIICIILCYK